MTDNYRKYYVLILCSVAFISCSSLYLTCTRGLTETLEAESAETAREFVEGAPLVINHLNGREDLDKPPLFYWAIALFSLALPSWELAARLPSILSTYLMVFLFWRLALSRGSPMLFAVSSLVFMSSPKVFWMSQVARIDMSFTAACFLSIYSFASFLEGSSQKDAKVRPRTPWIFFVSAAVAVMLKGPVGAILIFMPVIIFLALERKWALLKQVLFSRGMALFLALAIPWFVAASIETDYRFFHRFILEENLSRFTNLIPGGTFKEFNHSPLYTYPVYLLTGFFPWSLLIPFWFYDIIKNWGEKGIITRLFFVYIVFILVFFSLALSKRGDYILPLYPAAAFLTAKFLLARQKGSWVLLPAVLAMTMVTVAGALLSVVAVWIGFTGTESFAMIPEQAARPGVILYFLERATGFIPAFLALFITGLSGLYWCLRGIRARERAGFFSRYAIHVSMAFLVASLVIIPEIYHQKDARRFCKSVARIARDNPIYYFGFWDEECSFYLHRHVRRIFPQELQQKVRSGKTLFLIVREKDLEKLYRMKLDLPFSYKKEAPLLRPLILLASNKGPWASRAAPPLEP